MLLGIVQAITPSQVMIQERRKEGDKGCGKNEGMKNNNGMKPHIIRTDFSAIFGVSVRSNGSNSPNK